MSLLPQKQRYSATPAVSLVFMESLRGALAQEQLLGILGDFVVMDIIYSDPRGRRRCRSQGQASSNNTQNQFARGYGANLRRRQAGGHWRYVGSGQRVRGWVNRRRHQAERPRNSSLSLDTARNLISQLTGIDRFSTSVERVRITGRANDDDPLEIIDLFQHRERRHDQLEIDPQPEKIPHPVRWNTLREFHREYTAGRCCVMSPARWPEPCH